MKIDCFGSIARLLQNSIIGCFDLASSINTMADDIEGMLNARRELLLAISHELCFTLTRSRISAELLDDTLARDRINRDLDEMEQLISELLESERLNSRHARHD